MSGISNVDVTEINTTHKYKGLKGHFLSLRNLPLAWYGVSGLRDRHPFHTTKRCFCTTVIVCPSVRLGLTIFKFLCWLVWHRKRLCMQLNNVMLGFCFGGSHQSLNVHEVKCVPGETPLLRALFYLKGPALRCYWPSFT